MRPPGKPLCGLLALGLMLSPIHAANNRTSASTKPGAAKGTGSKKDLGATVQEHVVKKGETLWSISQKYSTSVGEVMELNKMPNEQVRDGMKLKIPPRVAADPRKERRKVHVVDDDETFWGIAAAYNVSPEALANANPNINPNRIHPDMELAIPPAGSGAGEKPAPPVKPAVTLKDSPALPKVSFPRVEGSQSTPTPSVKKEPPAPAVGSAASLPPAGGRMHTIAEGDTFYGLAKEYGVTMEAIIAANPQVNPRRMKNGIQVLIPGKPSSTSPAKAESAPAEVAKPAPAKAPEPVRPKPGGSPVTLATATRITPPANALPIPKPKINIHEPASEPVKKTLPDRNKEVDAGLAGSPVVVKAPSQAVPEPVNPPPPSAPETKVAPADTPPPATNMVAVADAPPASVTEIKPEVPTTTPGPAPGPRISTVDTNGGLKPPPNTVGSDGVIRSYIVSEGETEGTICEAFGISKEQLYEYNRLPATARLKAGDEIMIPRVAKLGR